MLSEDDLERLRAAAEAENGRRAAENEKRRRIDVADWTHRHFLIPDTQRPIVLWPHQQAVLRYGFRRLRKNDPRMGCSTSWEVNNDRGVAASPTVGLAGVVPTSIAILTIGPPSDNITRLSYAISH